MGDNLRLARSVAYCRGKNYYGNWAKNTYKGLSDSILKMKGREAQKFLDVVVGPKNF
jgi:hypothetical protein